MKKILWIICFAMASQAGAQKMLTRTGKAEFKSEAKLEKIEASSNQVTVLLNTETNAVAVKIAVRTFHFDKALMQEHFNENYLESDKFPEATFSGKITDSVDWKKDGTYSLQVEGDLTIHGVKKKVKEKITAVVKNGEVKLSSSFSIKLSDYQIKNDKMENISETISIRVEADLKKP